MQYATWVVFGILFILFLFLKFYFRSKQNFSVYSKKQILTNAEIEFLKVLKNEVGNTYDIFPQVSLKSLINVPYRSIGWNKTIQKSVDFVLADKNDFSTKLVIELDDSSHNSIDRRARDEYVDQILKNAGIPILHQKWQQQYDQQLLINQINDALSPSKTQ